MDSFIRWIGGKKYLRNRIVAEFPDDFERYVEVFGGAGWVLFHNNSGYAKFEVFNDIDNQLINLYRCLKYHSDELKKELDFLVHSRTIFFSCIDQLKAEWLTDIQRAARYFVAINESFGADRRSFATAPVNIYNKIERFDEIRNRLKNVVIECRDFEQIIKTYDREKTLFYLDPPYFNAEKYYNGGFGEKDHIRLRNALDKIKGRFLLSYNRDDFILDLYKNYIIQPVKRRNNLSHQSSDYDELIIKNY